MKRTCPKCKTRNRKKVMEERYTYDACANCGYVFKEDKHDRTKHFWEIMKYILGR